MMRESRLQKTTQGRLEKAKLTESFSRSSTWKSSLWSSPSIYSKRDRIKFNFLFKLRTDLHFRQNKLLTKLSSPSASLISSSPMSWLISICEVEGLVKINEYSLFQSLENVNRHQERTQRRNRILTGISWAVSSDSRAYATGIHSSGIKIDSSNNSQSWVEEQPSNRAWNSSTLVTKAMILKKWTEFSKKSRR